jgi:HlyD family secretion protein
MSKGKTAVVAVLSLVVVAAAYAVIASGDNDGAPVANAANTQPDGKRWLAVAPGRVEPRSGTVKVASPGVGIVRKVLVKVNDTVFAGEPLMLLDDDEIRSRYAAAEAQAGMRQRLRNEQPSSGKADERRKAEDALAEAETAVFNAQTAVDKAAVEWRVSGAPSTTLTEARSTLARAEADLTKRQSDLRGLRDAPLPTPLEAQVASARGDLALARVNLEKTKVRAPIDGTVLQININPGELAAPSASQPLLLIANLSTLSVRAELDERDVADIRVGQPASVRADAFPGRTFEATVASIAPLVGPARLNARGPGNRSDIDAVEVVVNLAQPGPLVAGMRVDVYFGPNAAAQDKTTGNKTTEGKPAEGKAAQGESKPAQ